MTNLTYKFGNDFENEAGAVSISIPAEIETAGTRGTVPAEFVKSGEDYVAFSVPANVIIKSFYLVVTEAMVGTVNAYLGASTGGTQLFNAASITSVGGVKSTVTDALVTTPEQITVNFSDAQTAGEIKIVFDAIFISTNTAKYVGA